MAKYTVSYSCGHGTFEKQLYGKTTERERYIAWAESNMLCPECYKRKAAAQDAAAEPVASIHTSSIAPLLICTVTGRTEANKQALYDLGFRWQRVDTGALAMLATTEPPKTLSLVSPDLDSFEAASAWVAGFRSQVEALGYKLTTDATALDKAFFGEAIKKRQAEIAAKTAALAANPAPVRPDWYKALRAHHAKPTWNGKIYGKAGAYRIYISDTEYRIADAQKAELEAFQAALAAHRKAKGSA